MEFIDDGSGIVRLVLVPGAEWARSRYPHPLIVVDYDADGNVIGISAAGSKAKALKAFWR